MKYTEGMEKAMHASHGVGYAVYSQKHEVRIDVEQQREEEYVTSRRIVADFNSKLTNHLS
ncbi:hypothetical protein [Domibacillus mangrovi]|uniref:Uncharacterized protein n=1 Tax=Domibacillus mangrovi TaxID=1714354 RepID=A0A1Q5P626_9BACI|nr:hypothetical protein [Domibacillus mangrovi]OKL37719.1 hypothetical protein BLL40_03360 [Domibacillus mangrovi]